MKKADKKREIARWKESARAQMASAFAGQYLVSRDWMLALIDAYVAWYLKRHGMLRDVRSNAALIEKEWFRQMLRSPMLKNNRTHIVDEQLIEAA